MTLGLLALGFDVCFPFVRRMTSGAGAVCLSLGRSLFGASHEFPWVRFTNLFIGVLGCCHRALGGRQTGYVFFCSAPP